LYSPLTQPIEGVKLTREQLDEFALATKHELNRYQYLISKRESSIDLLEGSTSRLIMPVPIPFCSFNGGNDVFVDVGNKLIGVSMLLDYLKCRNEETLHVGDQFLGTGNDVSTRGGCCTVSANKYRYGSQVQRKQHMFLKI
jgi:IMP and pyridine-specific 5'-nucleotidase